MTTYKIIHIIICDVMFNIDNFFNLPVYKRIEKNLKCDQEYTRFYDDNTFNENKMLKYINCIKNIKKLKFKELEEGYSGYCLSIQIGYKEQGNENNTYYDLDNYLELIKRRNLNEKYANAIRIRLYTFNSIVFYEDKYCSGKYITNIYTKGASRKYSIIITKDEIYLCINNVSESNKNKTFKLSLKWLSVFLNKISNIEIRKLIVDLFYELMDNTDYIYKDIKECLYNHFILLNIEFSELVKYHNIKELFLNKYKNLPNINFNKYNINVNYILIKIYNLIRQEDLQKFIIDFNAIFHNKFKDLNADCFFNYNFKDKYNVLYLIIKFIYYDNKSFSYLEDYVNLCKENKTKVNIKRIYNVKKLHDEELLIFNNNRAKKMSHKKKRFKINDKYSKLINMMPKKYELIKNEYELYIEGQEQHNCVYTYLNKIQKGSCIIYKCITKDNHYTIEISCPKSKNYILKQMRSTYNKDPDDVDFKELKSIIKNINQG